MGHRTPVAPDSGWSLRRGGGSICRTQPCPGAPLLGVPGAPACRRPLCMRCASVRDSGQGHRLLQLPPTPLPGTGGVGQGKRCREPAPSRTPAAPSTVCAQCSRQTPLHLQGTPHRLHPSSALVLHPCSQHSGAPHAQGSREVSPHRQPSGRRAGPRWRRELEAEPGRAPPRPPAHIGRPGGLFDSGACAAPGAHGGLR